MNQSLHSLFDNSQVPPIRVVDFFYDARTRIIYFLKSIENKKVKFSTKITLPEEASEAVAAIAKAKRFANRELTRRLAKKKVRLQSLIKDELELWLKVKESEGHKYDTLNNIRRAKRQIEEYWGEKFPREITRDHLTAWYTWWSENHPDIQMENAIKYLRNFCGYLAEKIVDEFPLLPAVPTIKDPGFREARARRQKKKERIIAPAEFHKIHKAATKISDVVSKEDAQLLVLFMYTMAIRVDETLRLRFDEEILLDLDMPVYRWRVGQNKADLWGEHAIHSSLIEPLRALRLRRNAQGTKCLFPQLRDNQKPLREQMVDWDGWRTAANLGWRWTPHTFRHTCLSTLFNDEKNPQALICKLYRVSLQTAMEHYIKPTQSGILKMQNAIEVSL